MTPPSPQHASDYHAPVLVERVLEFLEMSPPATRRRILDGTLGGGGHAEAILQHIPGSMVLGVDRDPDAAREARSRLADYESAGRLQVVGGGFDEVAVQVGATGPVLSGALLDLGISSRQIDRDSRGFTFRSGAPLDMRMAGGEGSAPGPTAADLLAGLEEEELMKLFREKGEERRARALARAVVERRQEAPFRTSDDLVEVLAQVYRRPPQVKEKARIFQALRIEVNDEIGALERALPALRDALLPGGVLVVIAYHSLEDRPVKRTFREWSRSCICPPELPVCRCRGEALGDLLTRSVVRPEPEEVQANPRSRSARLRAWRKAS